MRNKLIIILGVIVVLFGALYFVNNYKDRQALDEAEDNIDENPYGDKKLEQATIEQLDDPNYDHQIMPGELTKKVNGGEDMTVYFYSPECSYCITTTPVLVSITEELGIDMVKLNLLEFPQEWDNWNIESTPTVVHYEDSKEVARIIGEQPEEDFRSFFNEHVLD